MSAIVDTGFLVAFGNRKDQHHLWAKELVEKFSPPFLTCEAVLSEAGFHLGNAEVVFGFLRDNLVKPDFAVQAHVGQLATIAKRFADRHPDFADICLIRMSELHPRLPIITTDVADFSVYRRNHRERIPLIVPPHIRRR